VLLMLLAFWGIVQLLSLSQDNRELKEKNRQLKGQVEELKYHIYQQLKERDDRASKSGNL
jgi:hypothetical protein